MRILFIKPNMGLVQEKPYLDRGRMEPLTFAVLKGITPREHHVELCDDRFEPVPYDQPWDVVGINTEIYTARRAYEIADKFRALGSKVILGGFHTTLLPEESLPHADAIVTGDGDEAWPQILLDIASNTLKRTYAGCTYTKKIYEGVKTDWSVFQGKSYIPVALTQFSRGCSNKCEYCATGNIYCGSFVTRPVAETIRELEQDGRKFVFFADDNIIADIPAAKEFFKALIPLKVRWTGQASINFASDRELMDLMLKSGCSGLVVGFESRDPRNLVAMNKRVNTAHGTYDEIVERIRDAGLMIWAAFLLGYDHETRESIQETVEWAISKKFAFSAFNILMPYPGTPFYDRMKADGRLLYDGKWWLHDDYRFGYAGFKPKNMSPEDLSELGLWARKRHNTVFQIARRATDRKTNCKDLWSILIYLAYNPLFRDEMLKKHGMMLGYRGFEREIIHNPVAKKALEQLGENDLAGLSLEGVRKVFTKIAQKLA
jgi:radical SAM superfamily enzyme YgiQ (UPF0313 family)